MRHSAYCMNVRVMSTYCTQLRWALDLITLFWLGRITIFWLGRITIFSLGEQRSLRCEVTEVKFCFPFSVLQKRSVVVKTH